jgi:hypothetical protein
MGDTEREPRPEQRVDDASKRGDEKAAPRKRDAVPDGEAIAEVGDKVGGPA